LRKSSHPNPTIKFFDVNRLLRSIDVDSDVKNDPLANYDESESDDDDGVNLNQNVVARKKPTFTPSAYLPDDNDDTDIDLASAELEETLADSKPLPKKKGVGKVVAMSPMMVH
jgi:hypothetical protein